VASEGGKAGNSHSSQACLPVVKWKPHYVGSLHSPSLQPFRVTPSPSTFSNKHPASDSGKGSTCPPPPKLGWYLKGGKAGSPPVTVFCLPTWLVGNFTAGKPQHPTCSQWVPQTSTTLNPILSPQATKRHHISSYSLQHHTVRCRGPSEY